uniref:3-oxoadipate enol-lactonase n=1 Tax=Pseudophaeobacter arcticus TaxID=385492 RepID=UPI002493098C
MQIADLGDVQLHYRIDGAPDGAPIVFANSLGTDLRLWDEIVALLPEDLRTIRYDMRGHGQSDVPDAPYTMGQLVSDAEAVCDAFKLRDVLFVGLSVGGMVAQGLATKRLDLVRTMVLSNTAAKIGTHDIWNSRFDLIREDGMEAVADATMERWFSKAWHGAPQIAAWRKMLTDTASDGYIGCGNAIAGTDFYTTTAALKLPTLAIAGSEDGATPPDLIRETQELIAGSQFHLIRR